jgi:four helix bundle protein
MASGFKDLEVWQLARELAVDTYRISRSFPSDERFGLTSQIRRAAVSIAANLAEGHGRRLSTAFAQFVRISIGSLNEVETLMCIALDLKYVCQSDFDELEVRIRRLAVKLQNLLTALLKNPSTSDKQPPTT